MDDLATARQSSETPGAAAWPRASDRREGAIERKRADLSAALEIDVPADLFRDGPIDDVQSTSRLLRALLRKGLLDIDSEIAGEPIAKALGVHRNTISKVLRTLENEGYLYRRKGRPALVVAVDPTLPKRRTRRVSHTKVAEESGLEIRSVAVRCERKALSRLEPADEPAEVATRLGLRQADQVIVYTRIRELRVHGGEWRPAIAEAAYFAAERAPGGFYEGLAGVESIHGYLEAHGIAPIASEYRVSVAPLPLSFLRDWAISAHAKESAIAPMRFLRFESTTHCSRGPIEFSRASLAEGLFTLTTTDLSVGIENAVLSSARRAG